ncbi:MAG: hypothetical protein A2583_03520 [Bdellovibrionales bacterium RIFOXYD1_FULL_53_11]|nr:MAG: hypothetical protein A2583_03520 [Bdellovibrionales bacterium RIFOXYD1_FULL_53_11]
MLNVLPYVMREQCFALKGGTAINFFVREMPRLSVDIDLTYLPLQDRETSLREIGAALTRIAKSINIEMPQFKTQEVRQKYTTHVTKLDVIAFDQPVRIEPNATLRGAVLATEVRPLVKRCQTEFSLSVEARTLNFAELYAGKICAALDRQHPRDLYDVRLLLSNEGLTDAIRRTFVVYLCGHDRPISEMFEPTRKDIRSLYETDLAGMTTDDVSHKDLLDTREQLITTLSNTLTGNERNFLVSIKEGDPKWDLLGIPGIERLPSIQWKLMNIKKMAPKKHKEALARLKTKLGL